MEVYIGETAGVTIEQTAFADICKFEDVADWLEAITKGDSYFYPFDCSIQVSDGEKFKPITEAGHVHPDAQKTIESIRKVPERYRCIPSDTLQIRGDTFEKELFFKLNVPK